MAVLKILGEDGQYHPVPYMRGEKGEKGDKGEPGKPGLPGEPGRDGASKWGDITGKPAKYPTDMENVAGLPPLSASIEQENSLPTRGTGGNIYVPTTPNHTMAAASKGYVDSRIKVVTAPGSDKTVLYLIPE